MESGNCDSSSSSTTPYSSFLPPPYGATGPGRPQAFGAQQPCFYLDNPHFSQQQDINNMTDSSVPSQQQTQQPIPPLLETGTAFSTLLKIIQQQQQNGNNFNFSGFPLPYVPAPTTMGFGATSQQQISPRAQFVLSQNTSMPPTGVINGIVPLTPSVSVSMTAPPTQPSSPSPSVPLQPGFGYSFDGNIYQNSVCFSHILCIIFKGANYCTIPTQISCLISAQFFHVAAHASCTAISSPEWCTPFPSKSQFTTIFYSHARSTAVSTSIFCTTFHAFLTNFY